MTYQIICEKYNITSKDIAYRMADYKVAISTATISCRDKETGEYYKDEMWFVEILTIDKLMELIESMKDFGFTITCGIELPIDEWGFELVMGDEEEYLYRYPILWIN